MAIESDRVAISNHSSGDEPDWWAECLVCGAWVSTSNHSERGAERKFGRHYQAEHLPPADHVVSIVESESASGSARWNCSCGESSGGMWSRSPQEALKKGERHLARVERSARSSPRDSN